MAKILLIDDSKFICKALSRYLTGLDHEVVGMGHDGIEGLQLFNEQQPQLTLLDITMPNRDGRDCLRDIMAADANARVVMMSAVQEQAIIDECLAVGAKDFIVKPMKFSEPDYVDRFVAILDSALA